MGVHSYQLYCTQYPMSAPNSVHADNTNIQTNTGVAPTENGRALEYWGALDEVEREGPVVWGLGL